MVRVLSRSWSPGGAANVATNLRELGLQVDLVGIIGADDAGRRLRELLSALGIGSDAVLVEECFATIVKTRVIGGYHQMLRIDDEQQGVLDSTASARVIAAVEKRLAGLGALVLSDYAKGVCTTVLCQAVIAAARGRGIPVLVDPKGSDFSKYAGATTITPNTGELAQACGVEASDYATLVQGAQELRSRFALDFLTFTRSEHGIALIDDHRVHQIPATAREVFDVSGAGDTVIAVLAACLAGQDAAITTLDAVRLANLAAGIVVGKAGTVSVHLDELLASVENEVGSQADSKIFTLAETKNLCARWRAQGERVVFTNGCFDLIHAGHVGLLAYARQAGDRLVVGLNDDSSVRMLKGPSRPINPQGDRVTVLAALMAVDAIVVFAEETLLALINALKPDVLVKGADYRDDQEVGATEVRSWGGWVVLAPLLPQLSTTTIIERMKR